MDDIAILRLCHCCKRWLSIDRFKPLGVVCQPCVYSGNGNPQGRPQGTFALARGIVLTDLGRATCRAMGVA